jgi:hypothetical protein
VRFPPAERPADSVIVLRQGGRIKPVSMAVAGCQLPAASYQLSAAGRQMPAISHQLGLGLRIEFAAEILFKERRSACGIFEN